MIRTICLLGALSLAFSTASQAQALKKLKEKVNTKIEQAANAAMGDTKPAEATKTTNTTAGVGDAKEDIGQYVKYDFVPGDSVLFTDDFQGEESGEIPSKWLISQGKAEVYDDNGNMVISARKGTYLRPRMSKENYLPKQFTVEFDMKHVNYNPAYGRSVGLFLAEQTDENAGNFKSAVYVWASGEAEFGQAKGEWPYEHFNESNVATMKKWKHVAISVNEKGVKVYVNQFRILNAQVEFGKPTALRLYIDNDYDAPVLIRNFKVMAGGKSPAKQVTTNTVYIARGIQFERGSPKLLPESMGEINALSAAMKENTSLKFEIAGHTSMEKGSSAEANQALSEARAQAVREAMIASGIDGSRLVAKGYGQEKPLATNDTPEGRSSNRRVEFVRQ